MDLYNLNEIETELRATADAACGDGIKKIIESKDITIEEFIAKKEIYLNDFKISCHNGFKDAQNKIIKNILLFQDEHDRLMVEIKEARAKKDKENVSKFIKRIKHIENVVALFKHCADALVWQLIDGQLWINRRLYQDVKGGKKLREVNLESVVKIANKYNENPQNFVLITDITNNVQVGDIIGIIDNTFVVAEIKEGEKNIEILEIIEELSSSKELPINILKKLSEQPKMVKQLDRMIKQHQTLHHVHEVLNTDKGIDQATGKEIRIITPKEPIPTFDSRLMALENQLNERNFWAYDIIEDCLHIGIYKGEKRFAGHLILKSIGKQNGNTNFVIVDALMVIESLNKPLFFFPFSVDFIFDLIFNRTKMYFMLVLDEYMELYKNFDLKAEWASRKETAKTNELIKGHDIFKLNNRGIKIKSKNKEDIWLSSGILTRIFFEHVYPSYTAYSTHYYLGNL